MTDTGHFIEQIKGFETVKETDKTLSLSPRAVRAVFSGLEIWTVKREYHVREVMQELEAKLQKYPEEEIVNPEMYVAVPTIQAMSYSVDAYEIKEMFANLLTKAMLKSQKDKVHPSYIEIIKQLDPYDAVLLKTIASRKVNPIADLMIKVSDEDKGHQTMFANVYDPYNQQLDVYKSSLSITNLARLGILSIPAFVFYIEDSLYDDLERQRHDLQQELISKGSKSIINLEKKIIQVTPLGASFIDVCLN